MRLKALFLAVFLNAAICTSGARDIISKKASFDDSEPIFPHPFSGATETDVPAAAAIGSGIDGLGLGSLLGGAAGIGVGVKGGFGGTGFAIGGSLTSGGVKVGGGFRAGLP
ncbi:hypothetical protein POM88_031303 [Heracleum sosnowskyi]|uniref:Uncharacterized protein n=1 Tax=Heracleum sosnowskyi TaxID=360622 RepID=A0AAD8HXK1_9APIA|nr:hypothetical protein POM88_031303 [Heracleum sosnowskyi]